MGGFKDILVILGKSKEVREIDKESQKRKHLGPWGIEEIAKLYKGITQREIDEILAKYIEKNLRKGAKERIIQLKNKGFIVGALSSNPQFLMDFLAKNLSLGFSE